MHFLSSRGLKIWVGIALLKKKEMYFLEKAAVGKKDFSTDFFERPFSTGKFFFSTEDVEKSGHRLELIFVLISFTISANAASFFIFFSICWME